MGKKITLGGKIPSNIPEKIKNKKVPTKNRIGLNPAKAKDKKTLYFSSSQGKRVS